MCTEKERHTLLNINRILIYSFGLIGLFYDYTWAYLISMTLWVWLPNCIRLEWLLVERSKELLKSPHSDLERHSGYHDNQSKYKEQ